MGTGYRVPTIYVLSRNMKNIRDFLSENFQFLEVKFSIYLKRRAFVMVCSSLSRIISSRIDLLEKEIICTLFVYSKPHA